MSKQIINPVSERLNALTKLNVNKINNQVTEWNNTHSPEKHFYFYTEDGHLKNIKDELVGKVYQIVDKKVILVDAPKLSSEKDIKKKIKRSKSRSPKRSKSIKNITPIFTPVTPNVVNLTETEDFVVNEEENNQFDDNERHRLTTELQKLRNTTPEKFMEKMQVEVSPQMVIQCVLNSFKGSDYKKKQDVIIDLEKIQNAKAYDIEQLPSDFEMETDRADRADKDTEEQLVNNKEVQHLFETIKKNQKKIMLIKENMEEDDDEDSIKAFNKKIEKLEKEIYDTKQKLKNVLPEHEHHRVANSFGNISLQSNRRTRKRRSINKVPKRARSIQKNKNNKKGLRSAKKARKGPKGPKRSVRKNKMSNKFGQFYGIQNGPKYTGLWPTQGLDIKPQFPVLLPRNCFGVSPQQQQAQQQAQQAQQAQQRQQQAQQAQQRQQIGQQPKFRGF